MPVILLLFLSLILAAPAWAESKKPDHGNKGSGKEGEVVDPNLPQYVEIAPFVIPIIGPDGPNEVVSLIVTLELVPGEESSTLLKQRLPRLNDAYMQSLYGALDRRTVMRNGLVDVTLLKEKLKVATEKVMGPGHVTDVLVQGVSQRRVGRPPAKAAN